MYYNHNIRTNIQEWKNRLSKATYDQFGHQLKYCLNNIEENKQIFGIIKEAILIHPYREGELKKIVDNYDKVEVEFHNENQQASFCYQLLKHFIKDCGSYNLHERMYYFNGNGFLETKKNIIEELITPIFYFIHDKLDKSNSTVYLLEKYKKRTEWFTNSSLLNEYNLATKNYEQIFEDDLRLFLFDQGIDYPFSTPKSTSGRADIIGSIDTNNPIVIEIKLIDKKKKYGKKRVIDGFSQIVKYTNDFNKDVGYLVIFNVDNIELNFELNEANNTFPPIVTLNHKTYFIIVININSGISASKIGKTEVITIKESELVK